MEDDGFTIVKKTRRKPGKNKIITDITRTALLPEPLDIDGEVERINRAVTELKHSRFYSKFINLLPKGGDGGGEDGVGFLYGIGLGDLASLVTRYQTALLILIRDHFGLTAEQTSVYDPVNAGRPEADAVLARLGLRPSHTNTEARLSLSRPSLCFLPHCPKQLTNNLLYSNWSPQVLPRLLLLSNSLSSTVLRTPSTQLAMSAGLINAAVHSRLVLETPVDNCFRLGDVFNDLAVHRFEAARLAEVGEAVWEVEEPQYGGSQGDSEFIRMIS